MLFHILANLSPLSSASITHHIRLAGRTGGRSAADTRKDCRLGRGREGMEEREREGGTERRGIYEHIKMCIRRPGQQQTTDADAAAAAAPTPRS